MRWSITHTWRLWATLRQSKPLPERIQTSSQVTFPLGILLRWTPVLLVVYYVLISALSPQNGFRSTTNGTTMTLALVLPLILTGLLFSGTAYGLGWMLRIDGQYRQMQQRGLFDLLAVTPAGSVGVIHGIIATARQQIPLLERIPVPESPFSSGAARAAAGLVLLVALLPQGRQALYPILLCGVLMGFLYVDYVQSCCVAVLIGVIATSHTNIFGERWFALSSFLFVQAVV